MHGGEAGDYLPVDDPQPARSISAMIGIISQLHDAKCLTTEPTIIHTVIEIYKPLDKLTNPRYPILDLLLISSIAPAPEDSTTYPSSQGNLTQSLDDPLACLPFRTYRTPRLSAVPSQQDEDILLNTVRRTLDSYMSHPEPGNIVEQVVLVGYSSLAARARFQDPGQPSEGFYGRVRVKDDVWQTAFVRPLEAMRKEGKIESLESWTLKLHAWPLRPPTLLGVKCVVA